MSLTMEALTKLNFMSAAGVLADWSVDPDDYSTKGLAMKVAGTAAQVFPTIYFFYKMQGVGFFLKYVAPMAFVGGKINAFLDKKDKYSGMWNDAFQSLLGLTLLSVYSTVGTPLGLIGTLFSAGSTGIHFVNGISGFLEDSKA